MPLKRRANFFLFLLVVGIFVLSVLLILLMTRPARAAEITPSPAYSCEDVRRLIAERGKVAALALAVEHGLSLRQIWQIRRTCKV
jgi:hypothetical protein